MTDTGFTPTLYLLGHCPFCLKVRIFLLEAAIGDRITVHDFAKGTAEEKAARATLSHHLDTVSYPAAEIDPGVFIADSDQICAFLAERFGTDPATLPVYRDYTEGAFAMLMSLWNENAALKEGAGRA